jgi:hypothetical protein
MTPRAKTRPLHAALAERDERVASARQYARELVAQEQAANAAADDAREQLTEAFASGDEKAVGVLTKAKATAEASAGEPWAERKAGAERAAARAQSDRDAWATANISGLLSEMQADADAAVAGFTAAVDALELARREWHRVERAVLDLRRVVPGANGRDVPGIESIDQAVKDLRRAVDASLMAPMPRARHTAAIVDYPDVPDDVTNMVLGAPDDDDAALQDAPRLRDALHQAGGNP